MKCPFCDGQETSVIETRDTKEDVTRRRRECDNCQKRFTTYERIELSPIIVVKKNQDRECFDRSKVLSGILKSCEKRPVSIEQIESVVDEIESELRHAKSAEVPSHQIGTLIMKKIKKLDKVAYIRFASVYRDFKDIDSFTEEVRKLQS